MTAAPPSPAASRSRADVLGPLVLLVVVAAFAAWCAAHASFFEWSIDEGMYLMRARMARLGYRLYDDIWFNHPPLLVQLVMAAFERFGERVETARAASIALGAVGVAAVGLIARELDGWPAAVAAAAVVATAPLYNGLARAVMSSLPAVAMATLALALALRCGRTGRARWLAASGLAFGVGLAIKYIGLPLVPAVVLAAWPAARGSARRAAAGLAVWSLAAAAIPAAALAPYGLPVVLDQTVGSVLGARDAYPLDVLDNLGDAMEWLTEGHLGIALLGAFGLSMGLGRDRRWRVVALWLAADAAAVVVQAPLWSHHFVLPLVPLCVAAGHGLVRGAEQLVRRPPGEAGWRAFALTTLGAFVLLLPVSLRRIADVAELDVERAPAAEAALAEAAGPGGYAVTDSPMIAFRAGLRVPPNLCDPGAKRFESGDLTLADVADEVLEHRGAPVLAWNGRFVRSGNRSLEAWLATIGYARALDVDPGRDRILYAAGDTAPDAPPAAASPVGAAFDGGAALVAVELPPAAAIGATTAVTLHWQADGPTDRPLTVSLRIVEEDGAVIAQSDGPPAHGIRPTDHWRAGERIVDPHHLAVPPDASPGATRLVVRLYDAAGGGTRRVADPGRGRALDAGNALEIASIAVRSPAP